VVTAVHDDDSMVLSEKRDLGGQPTDAAAIAMNEQ
jgi:hypothetical protein